MRGTSSTTWCTTHALLEDVAGTSSLWALAPCAPHWHGFNKKHGIMATLNAQRYLRYTEIGSKGADPRARDQRASQYLRTLLQELGFVARADERAADGDDRVMLIGLPRWLPQQRRPRHTRLGCLYSAARQKTLRAK